MKQIDVDTIDAAVTQESIEWCSASQSHADAPSGLVKIGVSLSQVKSALPAHADR